MDDITAIGTLNQPNIPYPVQEKFLTISRHKELNNLAYEVKAFIDAHGGLGSNEVCMFGQLMQSIIHLK